MPVPDTDRRRLSDRVASVASLVDLRVRALEANLDQAAAQPPLEPSIRIDPKVGRASDYAIYDFTYSLGATDASKEEVFHARMSLSLVFRLTDHQKISSEELEAFGAIGVVEIAHPYVREIVHSLTFRMGLPPFVLDVAPPVVERLP